MRWPKYWSFSFSIIPSKEHPGPIFRMDWLDLLAVQETLKSLLQHHSSKASILWHSGFFTVQLSHPYMTTGKIIDLTRWTFVGKVSGGDGIPVELFQILKDNAVRALHSICQQVCKTQQWPQDWKRSVFIPIQRKAMPKNAQTTTQLYSSHTLVKQCSKFASQAWRIVNHELPGVAAGFRKGSGTRDQIAAGSWKKQLSSRKTSILLY